MEPPEASDTSATISASASLAVPLRIQDEFRNILLAHTSRTVESGLILLLGTADNPSSTYTDSEFSSTVYSNDDGMNSSNSEVNLFPSEAIRDLRRIAERMIADGHSRECVEVYASVRKLGLEQSLKKLSIEKLSSKHIQRLEWNVLEEKIRRWIYAARISVGALFPAERKLCEQIFKTLGTEIGDACFMETITDSATQLLAFAEAISSSRKSPEKLFKILDLYDVLTVLLPDIQTIFSSKSGEFIWKYAVEILSSLSVAARGILPEFENALLGQKTDQVPDLGGSIHPLNRYVMNYIKLMAEYEETLIELIVSRPSTKETDFERQDSPLVLYLVRIIEILKSNLEGKSKQYKDASLAHLFMMNNLHYIVRKIEESHELMEMIEDIYRYKLTDEYLKAAATYRYLTWEIRLLVSLRIEGFVQKMGSLLPGVLNIYVLRKRVKAFNTKFKEVQTLQSTWVVPDQLLREELRITIVDMVIPVYTSFLETYRSLIESGKQHENYITFSAEDLAKAVMGMFDEDR